MQEAYPADTVSLRSVTSDNFVIVETAAEDDGNRPFKKGGPEVIGEVDFSSALTTVHPKAIYLHQGQQYHVEHLDFDRRKAYVKPVNVDYYTDAIRYTQVRVLEIAEEAQISLGGRSFRQGTASAVPNGPDAGLSFRAEGPDGLASPDEVRSGPAARNLSSIAPNSDTSRQDAVAFRQGTASAVPNRANPSGVSTPEVRPVASNASRAHGDVLVRSQVIGFKKIKFFTNENVGDGKLELPENEMHTTAFWITLDRELLQALPFPLFDRQSGIFGLLYALESMAALLLMCDRRDLGTAVGERPPSAGIETEWQEFTGSLRDVAATREFFEPNLYIYDAYPGGIGFSEPLYRVHDLLLRRTQELIAACPCENGCPSCVGPAGEKADRAKEAALAILERLCS